MDPAQSGRAGAMGDIGSHAENLMAGGVANALDADYPRVEDGARGVRFIEKVLASAQSTQKWTAMD